MKNINLKECFKIILGLLLYELCEYICSSENSGEYLKNFKKIITEINKKFIELKNKN